VLLRVCASLLTSEQANLQHFFTKSIKAINLEDLEHQYNSQRCHAGLSSLSSRRIVNLNPDKTRYITRNSDPLLSWAANQYYVDLLVCVGRECGLDAIIPNADVMYTFDVDLQIGDPHRQFTARNAKLGFDPRGCMQWIGQSSWHEDIWLAWVPVDTFERYADSEDVPAGTISGSTTLSKEHYYGTMMFMAEMLKECAIADITVNRQYPDLDDPDQVKGSTNLL
jgi:hypothetical protein